MARVCKIIGGITHDEHTSSTGVDQAAVWTDRPFELEYGEHIERIPGNFPINGQEPEQDLTIENDSSRGLEILGKNLDLGEAVSREADDDSSLGPPNLVLPAEETSRADTLITVNNASRTKRRRITERVECVEQSSTMYVVAEVEANDGDGEGFSPENIGQAIITMTVDKEGITTNNMATEMQEEEEDTRTLEIIPKDASIQLSATTVPPSVTKETSFLTITTRIDGERARKEIQGRAGELSRSSSKGTKKHDLDTETTKYDIDTKFMQKTSKEDRKEKKRMKSNAIDDLFRDVL